MVCTLVLCYFLSWCPPAALAAPEPICRATGQVVLQECAAMALHGAPAGCLNFLPKHL